MPAWLLQMLLYSLGSKVLDTGVDALKVKGIIPSSERTQLDQAKKSHEYNTKAALLMDRADQQKSRDLAQYMRAMMPEQQKMAELEMHRSRMGAVTEALGRMNSSGAIPTVLQSGQSLSELLGLLE